MKSALIITGVIAWVGGMATMFAAPSCDIECIPNEATPSIILSLTPGFDTRWNPNLHPAEVTFQIYSPRDPVMSWEDDRQPSDTLREPVTVQEAQCMNPDCTTWTLGTDRPGRYEITATVRGREVKGWADVEVGADGCHAETTFMDLQIDATACDDELPPVCDAAPRPSVNLYVAKEMQDTLIGVDVDRVWYEHDGRVGEANCVTQETGVCDTWLVGRELEGDITLHTEFCDQEFTQTVTVGKTADDCHVATQFALMKVDTMGCLADPSTPVPHTDPPTPPESR
jgi:hypothetical protein